jgi:stage II sporulation protein R
MKNLLALSVTVILLFIVLGALPIHGEDKIYDNVIRLHVLANSDSDEDQALKLKVRDAILERSSELFGESESIEEAANSINANIDAITEVARKVISENGYDYPVSVTLTNEHYPTKSYEALSFPSGEYLSLRVMIGESEGQNWWCVLFPPLCLSAATDKAVAEDAFISVGLTGEQYRIITESDNTKYTVRFKILETIEGLK